MNYVPHNTKSGCKAVPPGTAPLTPPTTATYSHKPDDNKPRVSVGELET